MCSPGPRTHQQPLQACRRQRAGSLHNCVGAGAFWLQAQQPHLLPQRRHLLLLWRQLRLGPALSARRGRRAAAALPMLAASRLCCLAQLGKQLARMQRWRAQEAAAVDPGPAAGGGGGWRRRPCPSLGGPGGAGGGTKRFVGCV